VTQEQRLLTIEDLARKTSWSWRPVLQGGTAQDLIVATQSNPEGPAAQKLADEWLAAHLNSPIYQAWVEETDPPGFWYRRFLVSQESARRGALRAMAMVH
jgi:hypothetical protein